VVRSTVHLATVGPLAGTATAVVMLLIWPDLQKSHNHLLTVVQGGSNGMCPNILWCARCFTINKLRSDKPTATTKQPTIQHTIGMQGTPLVPPACPRLASGSRHPTLPSTHGYMALSSLHMHPQEHKHGLCRAALQLRVHSPATRSIYILWQPRSWPARQAPNAQHVRAVRESGAAQL
jgi:hypothetical protein